MKYALIAFLLVFNSVHAQVLTADTFQVYFRMNDPQLNKDAADYIDKLIFKDVLIHGQKLIILGYADYVGDSTYNETLSAVRAKNIQDYLVASGFERKDIKLCIGKGKINRVPVNGKDGFAPDRKVQIVIDQESRTDTLATGKIILKKDTSFITPSSRLKVNATYPLNILFKNSSSVILGKSYIELKKVFDFLVKNKTVRIQIEGHICCIDPKTRGDGIDIKAPGPLSLNRAKAIYDFLIEHGISRDRLKYIGLGGTVPMVYPEKTEDDKEQNRRVEIRILSK